MNSARHRAVLGFAAVALATAAGVARAQEPFPGLDAYITKAVQTWKVPGLSVAIVRNDSVIYAKGFGVVKAGGKTPVDAKTLFEIGSSSKAFTATVVAMLVTDGKMRFDDRLTTYLPDFRMYDAVANEGVTLRDALTHRSGIARGELVWLSADISRDEVLHRVRFLKPESPFRSRYSYQNMDFYHLPDGPEQRERDEKLRRFQGESDVSYDWLWRGSPLNDPDDESVTYPFAR